MTYFRFVALIFLVPGSGTPAGDELTGILRIVAVDLSSDLRSSNLSVELNWAKSRSVTGNDFRNGHR